jgi:plasmid stability protein
MQKHPKKGIYLNLHKHVIHQLRRAANHHHGTVAIEATRILEETLGLGHTWENVGKDATTENFGPNGLYVNLSEELKARLRLLAEKNYRSVAGEAAYVLETVLSLADVVRIPSSLEKGHGGKGQSGATSAPMPKPNTKLRKRPAPRPPPKQSSHPPK